MDNTEKFTQKSEAYSLGRPAYSKNLIDMLYNTQGFNTQSVIADVGSGTGIFTKQLVEKGGIVYAVEPNKEMRSVAENTLIKFKNFVSVDGTAENTTLDDHSVDFITVAQAFHWFDVEKFKKECKRILKPNGKIYLIWNTRDVSADINIRQGEIFKKYCPDFVGFSGGIQENDNRILAFFDDNFERVEFDNPIFYDKTRFILRSLSGSYSLKESDENYAEFLNSIIELFDEFSVDGKLIIPNKTVAYFNKK